MLLTSCKSSVKSLFRNNLPKIAPNMPPLSRQTLRDFSVWQLLALKKAIPTRGTDRFPSSDSLSMLGNPRPNAPIDSRKNRLRALMNCRQSQSGDSLEQTIRYRRRSLTDARYEFPSMAPEPRFYFLTARTVVNAQQAYAVLSAAREPVGQFEHVRSFNIWSCARRHRCQRLSDRRIEITAVVSTVWTR